MLSLLSCVCVQVSAVMGLSVLELCMLVAAQRLEDAGSCVFNFQVGCGPQQPAAASDRHNPYQPGSAHGLQQHASGVLLTPPHDLACGRRGPAACRVNVSLSRGAHKQLHTGLITIESRVGGCHTLEWREGKKGSAQVKPRKGVCVSCQADHATPCCFCVVSRRCCWMSSCLCARCSWATCGTGLLPGGRSRTWWTRAS